MEASPVMVKPYGDTLNDGAVQLSFTLPLPLDDLAREAARNLAQKMGLEQSRVVYSQALDQNYSFFIVYGSATHWIDLSSLTVVRPEYAAMNKEEVDRFIQANFDRKLVLIGACIESDAHTVGIDAIMNIKGYNGHKGIESYHGIATFNLGAQVSSEELALKATKLGADALLVSQVVTKNDIHRDNLARLIHILNKEGLRQKLVLIVGGPGITHKMALELGYDAGFGANTYPEEVASFVVQEMIKKGVK
ncbi:MAG: lysine 5,6-aminomutase subunit beta [Bacillota bacterium]